MFNEDKISLTEATVLALQGKLKLEETRPTRRINKRLKKVESVDVTTDDVTVSTDEDGNTTVETDKEIVTVSQKTTETDLPLIDEPIEDNEETIDVPVDGDETIIPEEEVSEETIAEITDDKVEDNENTEEDDKVEDELDESKKIKKESSGDKNQFSFSFTSETQFGSLSNTDAKETLMELQEYFQEYSDEIAANKWEYLDNAYDMQTVATMLYQANKILEKSWLEESKKVEENVEIEVSEDGTEVEVKTDEGENVEVIDETEEPKTSDENVEAIENLEIDESKKLQKKSKSSINYNKKSFEEALTKFYKFNSKKVESFNLKSIAQNRKGDLKIEGKLNNKVPVTMIFNKKVEGKLFNRYTLVSTNNILKESKDITTNLMIAKNGKTFECRYLISK